MYLQLNNRKNRSLNDKWGFFADNMGAFGLKRSRNVFEGLKPSEDDRALEYDVDAFEQISVPGDWNTQKKEYYLFEGFGWYTKRLQLTAAELGAIEAGERLFLRLDGVNYGVDIWWNGEKIGSEELPFLPLSFELERAQLQESNLLVIRVDARRQAHRIPAERYDWFNYGGLIRGVRLVTTPATFIAQAAYHSTVIIDSQDEASVIDGCYSVVCNGLSADSSYTLALSIPELGFKQRYAVTTGEVELSIKGLKARLWEPGQAQLYRSTVTLYQDGRVVDRIAQQVGFKQIEVVGTQVLLNRKPLFLKGTAYHEERLGKQGGKPRNLGDVRQLIDLAEDLGSNFLRLAHYPYDESWLQECDARGLLVWDEIPVYWEITYDDERTSRIIHNSARRMVEVSRGHACMLCHAMANETWELPGRKETMGLAYKAFKELDPSIPVTAAFNAPYQNACYDVESVEHSIYQYVDVVGLNEYGGWYNPPLEELKQANVIVGSKPLFITEFGAAGPMDIHGESDKLWNLDSQKAIYEAQLGMFERCQALSGFTPWVIKDFRSTLRANGFQQGWNRKGLVDPEGRKKPVFDVIKQAFSQH